MFRCNLHMIAAASDSSWMTFGLFTSLSLVKNAGKSTGPLRPSANVPTQTPSVSRYSNVREISRKLLHPELITVTGVRPSSVRSAAERKQASRGTIFGSLGYLKYPLRTLLHDAHHLVDISCSHLLVISRSEAPSPPVPKILIPARCAKTIVPEIVVPPWIPLPVIPYLHLVITWSPQARHLVLPGHKDTQGLDGKPLAHFSSLRWRPTQ
jgi:hypothetical protein